jgi:hypothetical protein
MSATYSIDHGAGPTIFNAQINIYQHLNCHINTRCNRMCKIYLVSVCSCLHSHIISSVNMSNRIIRPGTWTKFFTNFRDSFQTRKKVFVGKDSFGNQYYEEIPIQGRQQHKNVSRYI